MNKHLHFEVPGDDFTRAGEASAAVKRTLKQLGFPPDAIRRVAIAMYEGEINMVIHAGGGEADIDILPDRVTVVLTDHGPGIPDVEKAMQEGWSTAPDNIRSLGFGAGMGLSSVTEWKNRSITKPPCFRQTWTVRVMVVPAPMTVSIAI